MRLPQHSSCRLLQRPCRANVEREQSDRQFRNISHTSTSVQINELAGSRRERRKIHKSCKKNIKSSPIMSLSPGFAQTPEPGPVPGLPGPWTQSHPCCPCTGQDTWHRGHCPHTGRSPSWELLPSGCPPGQPTFSPDQLVGLAG